MAGQLIISTLSDGTNSTSSTNCIKGSAQAWISFTYISFTLSTLASYNVSSITKSSAGVYVIVMTNALIDANYAVIASAGAITTAGSTCNAHPHSSSTATYVAPTSSTFTVNIVNEAGTSLAEPYTCAVAVHR